MKKSLAVRASAIAAVLTLALAMVLPNLVKADGDEKGEPTVEVAEEQQTPAEPEAPVEPAPPAEPEVPAEPETPAEPEPPADRKSVV